MNDSLIGKRFGRLVVATEMERRHSGRHVGARVRLRNFAVRSSKRLIERTAAIVRLFWQSRSRIYCDSTIATENRRYGCGIEYRAWSNAGQKVNNVNAPGYPSNGAKGIKLCAEWDGDFPKFFEQMGPCPVGHCLVRLDPNADFSKQNCRWSPEQARFSV